MAHRSIQLYHCKLNNIRSRALNRSIYSIPFTVAAYHSVSTLNIFEVTTPSRYSLNIPFVSSNTHLLVHVFFNTGIRSKIAINSSLCLFSTHVCLLTQTKGTHSVDYSKVDRFRIRSLFATYLFWRYFKYFCSSCFMNVLAVFKGAYHGLVFC